MCDKIKVVVKVRPLISREIEEKQQPQWRVNNNTLFQLDSNGRDSGQSFTFDKVYCENTKTSDVYNDVAQPIVEAAVAGFNGTIFAYGQTSSGKTYTMTGTDESPGIIPLAVVKLFEIIKNVPGRDFVVSVSYIELYNETLRDLLDLSKTVNIHQTFTGIKVDATDRVTASPEEVLEAMKEGNANRQTASTKMNESSSRSHAIFQINIESREHIEGEEQAGCVNVSQLNLVDLAGSERAGQTGATGQRFKEGTAINKSLTSLALVINQLSEDQNKYINYRDSKLTRILQNSLGGNAKTSIICAITPAALEETNSTLQFATRAKTIKNKPEVNAVATDATMIQKLTKQLSMLQSQLESKKNLEVMLETKKNVEQDLQKQIANLQRFILNGCGQRPTVELMGGARRKLLPPRRITISTLHMHSIEEDVPKVPKFSTPSLKYNPDMLQNAGAFLPVQNISKLTSLPEEPPRLVTPPPNERKFKCSDEVIELDSDDDETASAPTCSPHHYCYNASRTPPCVLRKNAKQAERSLKDLVELTDREKMYSPDVVELIEKLEKSSFETAKLQDEIEVLKTVSKDKDLEIESLRSKINSTESNIKRFTSERELELKTRKELSTKLTDLEVSYETLQTKAKLREQELLSLLEEQRIKQADDIGKMLSKPKDKDIIHFMDMSKDISLVNSDNESSIISPDDKPSERSNILIKDLQAQLAVKNQIIVELETSISTQKQQILDLEKSSHDLQCQVHSFHEKISFLENENLLLQSTINELNRTVKSQKENLELAQNDINSYNSVVQELQIKLTRKENLLDMNISDAILESMMANEDKTIANNETIKSIIHSLKLALENSKKEIDLLKSRIQNNNESGDTKKIEILNEKIYKLTKQLDDNILTIDMLLREKDDLALIEQEHIKKISEVEQKNSDHDILSKEQALLIETLKKDSEQLKIDFKFKADQEHLQNVNETLVKQIYEAQNRITILEEDILNKDTQIIDLNSKIDEYQESLIKANLAIKNLQNIFLILTGDVQETPKSLDSFVTKCDYLNKNLNRLENIAIETVAQIDLVQNDNTKLKEEMTALVLQHKSQISDATIETKNLSQSIKKLTNEIKLLNDKNSEQSNQIKKLQQELIDKEIYLSNIEMQLETFREADRNILSENAEKDLIIASFKENETKLVEKVKILEDKRNDLEDKYKDLGNKEEKNTQQLNELDDKLQKKCIELAQVRENLLINQKANDEFVENIIRKLSCIIDNIREKNSSVKNSLMFEKNKIQEPNNILPILDAVSDHILSQSSIENDNNELKSKIEIIKSHNQSLECDLKHSSELLRQIQDELKIKSTEIDSMRHKANDWKDQFLDLDESMKEQMLFLQSEQKKLKSKSLEINKETKKKLELLEARKDDEQSLNKSSIGCEANPLPSLFTICCNKIVEVVDQKQNESLSANTSTSCVNNINKGSPPDRCLECDQLVLELHTTQQENVKLQNHLENLEIINEELTQEHREMSNEVILLLELTQELQKKIVNHRTNLSILTATTYAENKSLKSQVKGLQHHHSRFHNVCQRDIPEFKKQLNELMTILKDDSSFCDALNSSYKRNSLPNLMENTATSFQIRNESTFDGDLLMLDTNVTLTTVDNTLVGYNQTCLDMTQMMLNETDCQTVDHNLTETNMLRNQIDILKGYNESVSMKLESLTKEKEKLKEQITKYLVKTSDVKDTQTSPLKINSSKVPDTPNGLEELELMSKQLLVAKEQKEEIEQKYNDLVLEIPSTKALVHKLQAMEEEYKNKVIELSKITNNFNVKNKELKDLQQENDLLSTQVMEHISEADDLNKEVEQLKQQNMDLLSQCHGLEIEIKSMICPQCGGSDRKNSTPKKNVSHSKLNRSLSDSDTTSRHNKICTLQNEIYAGQKDCKVLTEDVVTIKHHLDHSNMSMDLDESLNFELANDSLPNRSQSKACIMLDIQKEMPHDVYLADKNDCFNYYLENTGIEKDKLTSNIKIVDIMKLLHQNLITEHCNEVQNLTNKLKDYEELHAKLQEQINTLNENNSKFKRDMEERDKSLNFIANIVIQLKDNLRLAEQSQSNSFDFESNVKMSGILKDKFLTILDNNFNLSSVKVFDQITAYYNKLFEDFSSVNVMLTQTKNYLAEKEKEYNVLKAHNDKIHEINNAVTLDIVKREQDSVDIIKNTYQKLVALNMIIPDKVPLSEPVDIHVLIRLLEHFINEYQEEKAKTALSGEVNSLRLDLAEKEKQLQEFHLQNKLVQSVNNTNIEELKKRDEQIQKLEALQDELNSTLTIKVEEHSKTLNVNKKLSEDISKLKDTLYNKEKIIMSLRDNEDKIKELLVTVKNLHDDNEKLKSVNEMISKETESYTLELEKSCATIKQNNIDIDRMTSDILVLRESMKEATAHVGQLKQEVLMLRKENEEVKRELEVKRRDCTRLELNIKTHEKTAEVQSRIIMRLKNEKEEDDKGNAKLSELTQQFTALRAECEILRDKIKTSTEEIEHLKTAKQSLESRLAEIEESDRRSRASIDAVARRRQSLHDSKRLFDEFEEHKNIEAVFGSRHKSDDFFDDDDVSDRSTPFGLEKGRDSTLSRTNPSDKDGEHSRPSSALAKAARRRRQSSHDLHRSVTPHAPSPTDLSNYVIDEMQQLKAGTSPIRLQSENESQLRAQLAACQQELEELKERFREVDEECDICSEYLKERDQQCSRLKREKTALENQVMELKAKVCNPSSSMIFNAKPSVAHVSVNTDEDWTNLYSVVVDRMSYDAEVEKNKRLAKTIEELRFTKQDLRNTLSKMQKALEKHSSRDNSRELEETKKQLRASNDELRELRKRYKELDEECATCAQYLKEREEQCRRLKEAKAALEAKLEELQEQTHSLEHTKSTRKKRQTVHDLNRPKTSAEQIDATCQTTDDLLSFQVERDESTQVLDETSRDVDYLKKMVGRLTQQKMHLEMQLRTAHAANPMFVATGSAIVQNQQITDVMKENHKLKKMNAKLVSICRKRGKSANRENEDPCEQG